MFLEHLLTGNNKGKLSIPSISVTHQFLEPSPVCAICGLDPKLGFSGRRVCVRKLTTCENMVSP